MQIYNLFCNKQYKKQNILIILQIKIKTAYNKRLEQVAETFSFYSKYRWQPAPSATVNRYLKSVLCITTSFNRIGNFKRAKVQ